MNESSKNINSLLGTPYLSEEVLSKLEKKFSFKIKNNTTIFDKFDVAHLISIVDFKTQTYYIKWSPEFFLKHAGPSVNLAKYFEKFNGAKYETSSSSKIISSFEFSCVAPHCYVIDVNDKITLEFKQDENNEEYTLVTIERDQDLSYVATENTLRKLQNLLIDMFPRNKELEIQGIDGFMYIYEKCIKHKIFKNEQNKTLFDAAYELLKFFKATLNLEYLFQAQSICDAFDQDNLNDIYKIILEKEF